MDGSPQLEQDKAATIGPLGSRGTGRRIFAAIGIVAAILLVGAWWRRSSPEQCYRRGRDALAAGNLPAALREAERLIHIPGSEPQGRLLKGLSLVRSGKPAEALAQLEQASVAESTAVEASAAAAQCFYLLGRHLKAIDAALAALSRDANCLDARRWLAAAYYDLGATPHAVAELQQISAAAPHDPRPDRLLGLIGKDGEQFAQAIEHYRESLRRDPHQPDRDRIIFELAESLIHLGRFDEALAVMKESERSAAMLTLDADCLHGLGKLDAAQETLRSAVELDPQYFPARLSQGKLFLIAGHAAEAERTLAEAAELEPNNSQVHFQLSQAWKRLEKPQQAAAELHRMREIQALEREFSDLHETAAKTPADANVRCRLGELACDLGKPELAQVWFRAALAIDPNHVWARAGLAKISLSDRRDPEQPRQAFEKQVRPLPPAEPRPDKKGDLAPRQTTEESRRALPRRSSTALRTAMDGHEVETALDYVPEWRPRSGFSGSESCRQCHPDQFDTYAATPHSRALSDVVPEHEPAGAEFDHAASGRRYRVVRGEGRLIHEESLPLDDGTEFVLTRSPVRYRVGSGHFARTYLCDAGGGFLVESPVTWYEAAQAWGMTPGFDKPAHRSFSRQVLENCLWCHSGQVRKSTVSDMRFQLVENAIGCERCHGPGAAHVRFQTSGESADAAGGQSIVNPSRLPRKLAEAVCQQCHLQGDIHIGGRKIRATEYRPGEPLEKFGTVYRLRREDQGMTVVGHVEQLGDSPCYRGSATLTCVTCHDPHVTVAPADRTAYFRSVCLSCHADRGCKLALTVREQKSQDDCIQCHMPKSATEVPHLAFTHHRIGIHPLIRPPVDSDDNDPLVPLSDLSGLTEAERERSLMLARLQMFLMRGTDFQSSALGRRLLEQIDEWLQRLRPQEFDVEIEFDRLQLSLARGDLRAAEGFAGRTLACDDIRSEEAAAVLSQLGQLEYGQKQLEPARSRFGKLALLRCNGHDWFNLGMCEANLGRPDEAIRALDRARRLEPAVIGIYEALTALHHVRNDVAAERRLRNDIDRLKRRPPVPSVP